MMNIIGYIRVSTDEQAEKGYSLTFQEEAIKRFCQNKGYNLIEIYREDFSAFKKFEDRPEWNKINQYVKNNKGFVSGILCLRWDRFARNLFEALKTIKKYKEKNIEILTIENPLDLNNPESKLLLSIFLSQAEIESDKNSLRTKQASRVAKIKGCWMGQAPFGYKNHRTTEKHSSLKICETNSKLVVEVFEKMSSGIYSSEELRRDFSTRGLKLSKQAFLSLLRNIAYTGKIFIPKTEKEPSLIVEGLHDRIVSDDVFQKVQDVLSGKKPKMKFHLDKVELYPLKSFLYCEIHQRTLTAAGNRSGNGSIHHYYHCSVPNCKKRFRTEVLEEKISSLFDSIKPSNEIIDLYKSILENKFAQKNSGISESKSSIEKKLNVLKEQKDTLEDNFLSGKIEANIFSELNNKLSMKINTTELELAEANSEQLPYKKLIKDGVGIISNIGEFFRNSNGTGKQKILGSMFSGKLEIENNEVRTAPWRDVVADFLLINNKLGGDKIKKVSKNADLSSMAPLTSQNLNQIRKELEILCGLNDYLLITQSL